MGAKGVFFISLFSGFMTMLFVMFGMWHPNGLIAPLSLVASIIAGVLSGGYWLHQMMASNANLPPSQKVQFNFDDSKPHELVDYIDEVACSCLIATNSGWLKNNWHIMNDDLKTRWVSDRFAYLSNELKNTPNSTPYILNALQKADKTFTRSIKKTA